MRGKKTPPADVRRGLEAYLRLGSYAAASEETGIVHDTIRNSYLDPDNADLLRELAFDEAHARKLHARALALEAWQGMREGASACRVIVKAGKPMEQVAASRALAEMGRTAAEAVRLDEGTPTSISKALSELTDEEVIEGVNKVFKHPVSVPEQKVVRQ